MRFIFFCIYSHTKKASRLIILKSPQTGRPLFIFIPEKITEFRKALPATCDPASSKAPAEFPTALCAQSRELPSHRP